MAKRAAAEQSGRGQFTVTLQGHKWVGALVKLGDFKFAIEARSEDEAREMALAEARAHGIGGPRVVAVDGQAA